MNNRSAAVVVVSALAFGAFLAAPAALARSTRLWADVGEYQYATGPGECFSADGIYVTIGGILPRGSSSRARKQAFSQGKPVGSGRLAVDGRTFTLHYDAKTQHFVQSQPSWTFSVVRTSPAVAASTAGHRATIRYRQASGKLVELTAKVGRQVCA
jgi:hypothetical protein